jgi:hypothetical protein
LQRFLADAAARGNIAARQALPAGIVHVLCLC